MLCLKLRLPRLFWAVCCLTLALSLGLGWSPPSSAATQTRPPKILVLDTSPQTPVAGETYTIVFAVHQGQHGPRLHMDRFDCFAQTNKRALELVGAERGENDTARCTWAIPAKAAGETMHGILYARINRTDSFRGFETPIR